MPDVPHSDVQDLLEGVKSSVSCLVLIDYGREKASLCFETFNFMDPLRLLQKSQEEKVQGEFISLKEARSMVPILDFTKKKDRAQRASF